MLHPAKKAAMVKRKPMLKNLLIICHIIFLFRCFRSGMLFAKIKLNGKTVVLQNYWEE